MTRDGFPVVFRFLRPPSPRSEMKNNHHLACLILIVPILLIVPPSSIVVSPALEATKSIITMIASKNTLLPLILLVGISWTTTGFSPALPSSRFSSSRLIDTKLWSTEGKLEVGSPDSPTAPPVLNGKRVLPYKVMAAGLKGHKVAGIYAILNKDFKRGYVCIYVIDCCYVGFLVHASYLSRVLFPCLFPFQYCSCSKPDCVQYTRLGSC